MKLWLSSWTYIHIIWPRETNAIQPGILCGPLGLVLSSLSQAHPLFLETNSSLSVEPLAEELWSHAWSVNVRWDDLRTCQSPYSTPGSYGNPQLPVWVSIMKNHHCQQLAPLSVCRAPPPPSPSQHLLAIPAALLVLRVEGRVKPCPAGLNAQANALFAVFVFSGLTWYTVIAGTRLNMQQRERNSSSAYLCPVTQCDTR